MTQNIHTDPALPLGTRKGAEDVRFRYQPDENALGTLKSTLELSALRKVRLEGVVTPIGDKDWSLEASLGATVVQPCVVTLDPVTTRIDQNITRRYVANLDPDPEGGETEMPEDDSVEPIPEVLDLAALLAEALAIALPDFPRADGAALETTVFTEPGKAPMQDEDTRPFAALKQLRDGSGQDET